MERTTHERALRAAIRLALGTLILGGCDHGEAQPVMAQAPTEPARENASVALDDEDAVAARDAGQEAPKGAAKAAAKRKVDACRAKIDAKLGASEQEWWRGPEQQAREPELSRCCEDLAQVNDAGWVANTGDVRAAGCCRVSFAGQGPACTPWGPPMPPRMPAWAV